MERFRSDGYYIVNRKDEACKGCALLKKDGPYMPLRCLMQDRPIYQILVCLTGPLKRLYEPRV